MTDARDTPVLPLSSPRRTLPIALLRAREAVMDRYRPLLRGLDLTEAQWRVLRVLRAEPGLEATQLAEEAVILAPSLTRVLKTLESRGYVTAQKDSGDRRRTVVHLTDAGAALLNGAASDSAAITAELEAQLGQPEMDSLLDALERLLDRLEGDGPPPSPAERP